jgi:hypothetical protein
MFKDNGNHLGFFAHELQDSFNEYPTLVNGKKDAVDNDGNISAQSVESNMLTIVLMKAIKELNDIVKSQQVQIDSLKTILDRLTCI